MDRVFTVIATAGTLQDPQLSRNNTALNEEVSKPRRESGMGATVPGEAVLLGG